jgi:hypothetical protein
MVFLSSAKLEVARSLMEAIDADLTGSWQSAKQTVVTDR